MSEGGGNAGKSGLEPVPVASGASQRLVQSEEQVGALPQLLRCRVGVGTSLGGTLCYPHEYGLCLGQTEVRRGVVGQERDQRLFELFVGRDSPPRRLGEDGHAQAARRSKNREGWRGSSMVH